MTALVRADLRARWRSLAALAGGCVILLLVLAGTYSAYGGAAGFAKAFGSGHAPKLFSAFSGSSSVDIFSPKHFLAFGFGHPLFLVLSLSIAITSGVASVATDVETGRSELLFTAPVRRTQILWARVTGWLLAQAAATLIAVGGALLGSRLSHDLSSVSPLVPFRDAVQFGSLACFVGAVSFAASSRASTRGAALGIAVGVTAGSYVANLVALLWSPVSFVRHIEPFGYYSPTDAATHVEWGDAAILVTAAAALFVCAQHWLERRDLA